MKTFDGTELPKYRCHKKVWALKIKEIDHKPGGGAVIHSTEKEYAPFKVTHGYMLKHNPVSGGYYVKYQDGYESFSPAKEFEDGYVKIE